MDPSSIDLTVPPRTKEARRVLASCRDGAVTFLHGELGFAVSEALACIEQLPERIAAKLVSEMYLTPDQAERAAADGILFTRDCALELRDPRVPVTDSQDYGWHMFMIYNPEYTAVCLALGGFVVMHVVNDVAGFPRRGWCNGAHCDVLQAAARRASVS